MEVVEILGGMIIRRSQVRFAHFDYRVLHSKRDGSRRNVAQPLRITGCCGEPGAAW